jgi:tellurite resistance protein TerC
LLQQPSGERRATGAGMEVVWAWLGSPEFLVLVGFHIFVVLMLALDLGVFHRQAHAVSMKEAGVWSAIWVALAFLFAAAIWKFWPAWRPTEPDQGATRAVEFITGYLVEKSLSVDNLFVFLVIFRYFAVPAHLQHRVLVWGIVGAIFLRAALILLGAALIKFHFMIYLFGALLIYSGYKFLRVEEEIDPSSNRLLRLAKRFIRVVPEYDSTHFWVKRHGVWHATLLPLVLLVVESTDVVFALDSIPAIFALTKDPFIVYTSNIFAILGLRALFFLLSNFLGMFRYLRVGLALVLIFVGLKMILEYLLEPYLHEAGIDKTRLILISLGTIATILTVTIVASIIAGPKEPIQEPPATVTVHSPELETEPDSPMPQDRHESRR